MEQSVGWINFNLNRLYKYVQTIFLEKTGKNWKKHTLPIDMVCL